MSKKIKDEQKKFLGETLNQYNKALDEAINQLDKKNREQNHKISSLVNSFDNEFLEKDVEGNMTTLENSKDGMVIINEIQGNTEVNYCKDGEKELILNGDIDTQGESFVTITEGVDGGLVDVSLEGNTEINLSSTKDPVLVTREFDDINCNAGKLQYTIDDVTTINDEPGKVDIDRIVGDTMVNHAVNGSEELILNAHIDESGDNNITLNGVTSEGGLVDVALEGNTMVNVCDQKDPVAITKSYTVETGNHVALQGEYDGKCRPVVTGNTLVNLIDEFWETIVLQDTYEATNKGFTLNKLHDGGISYFKYKLKYPLNTSKKYTIIYDIIENTLVNTDSNWGIYTDGVYGAMGSTTTTGGSADGKLGKIVSVHPVKSSTDYQDTLEYLSIGIHQGDAGGKLVIDNLMLLEGDYTNKPIPSYFQGLQSSFEDKVVTQEMVDAGEELAENLGKYKVDYVISREDGTVGQTKTFYLNSPLLEGDTIEQQGNNVVHVHRYGFMNLYDSTNPSTIWGSDGTVDGISWFWSNSLENGNLGSYVVNNNDTVDKTFSDKISYIKQANAINIGFPEGILTSNDDAGVKAWIQENNPNVVYKLKTPTYEVISQNDTILCDSYVNGHLDVDSVVPIEKVDFLHFEEELTYLYANTQYAVQFVSDAVSKVDITLGGAKLLNQNVVVGTNKYTITTPSELIDNNLVLNGEGFNASNIVVTEATDQDFGYFEGMKSVGECEDLEVVSSNKNLFDIQSVANRYSSGITIIDNGIQVDNSVYSLKDVINIDPNKQYTISWNCEKISGEGTSGLEVVYTDGGSNYRIDEGNKIFTSDKGRTIDFIQITYSSNGVSNLTNIQIEEGGTATDYIPHAHNTQTLTHEPLRAVGDIKDKYVLIDGKWYIERKCQQISLTKNINYWINNQDDAFIVFQCAPITFTNLTNCSTRNKNIIVDKRIGIININPDEIFIKLSKDIAYDVESFKNYLPINLIIPVASPTYEPIDYNPLETYSDITHISNNSTIPCNMIIKNHGYNLVALKENTQYTLYVDKNTTNALTYRLGDYVEINSLSKFTFTTPSTLTDKTLRIDSKGVKVKDLMLIEGTPTNDSIGYFDGLKSSYECEQVTDENDENYGKYKVDVKVVGKNLFDGKVSDDTKSRIDERRGILFYNDNSLIDSARVTDYIKVEPNTTIIYTGHNLNAVQSFAFYDFEKKYIAGGYKHGAKQVPLGACYFRVTFDKTLPFQVEYGDTATEYEPYFESKQIVYLNSPLLKDDEIIWKDNKIQHYHKMGSVILDGREDEDWRYFNNTIVAKNNTIDFYIPNYPGIHNSKVISNKFITNNTGTTYMNDKESISGMGGSGLNIWLSINKLRLKTQNVIGLKQWLQQNPITVVYELETPYYEEISDYPLKLNVIANSSLSTESTIQVTNISFNIYEETLPYLYPNTKYYITFNADVDRNNIIIDLGGSHVALDCKVGFNKVEITTPSDTTNLLTFSGTGVNIDHVKVTQQDIDEYFEGMKSVGECEELEITSANSDNTLLNTQQLNHEPLRAVGDVKDRYVLIDGKWYIERNCEEIALENIQWEYNSTITNSGNTFAYTGGISNILVQRESNKNYFICNIVKPEKVYNHEVDKEQITQFIHSSGITLRISRDKLQDNSVNSLKEYLSANNAKLVYQLASPQYEPIDYNPFEVYNDTTHITTNSLIPTNMVIKNHGYNCILKPSTTYTIALNKLNGTISTKLGGSAKVDSTNNILTITTPSTLSDNVLRLSGSGNVKDIMILEGDKTVNTPSYFEGIESVFEQEYDTEKGKYRVTARVEGNGKESTIIFYINEPLRGTGTAKDKVFIQDGKVVVQRNCGSLVLDGTAPNRLTGVNPGGYHTWTNSTGNTVNGYVYFNELIEGLEKKMIPNSKINCNTLPSNRGGHINVVEGIILTTNYFGFSIHKAKLGVTDVNDQQQNESKASEWFKNNPVTVVYQLAEPVYEEVDCDLSKLALENYENSSLIFESNIPVSANIKYSGEVPVVTQAKTLSSQVDNTTLDINENIIPYMCDIDYRIVELQLMNGDTQGEGIELLGIGDIEILGNENVLFNNREDKKYNYSYDMLKRDILSQRYSKEEYQYRLDRYLLANKISDEEYKELEGLLNNGK